MRFAFVAVIKQASRAATAFMAPAGSGAMFWKRAGLRASLDPSVDADQCLAGAVQTPWKRGAVNCDPQRDAVAFTIVPRSFGIGQILPPQPKNTNKSDS